jgi:hypothetical protein
MIEKKIRNLAACYYKSNAGPWNTVLLRHCIAVLFLKLFWPYQWRILTLAQIYSNGM